MGEEEEEEDEGENRPLSPEALELIRKIDVEHKFFDFWQLRDLQSDWRIKRFGLCLGVDNMRHANRCRVHHQKHQDRKATAQRKMAEIQTKVDALEKELDKEITNKQQQERTLDQEIRTKDRKLANLDAIILFLDDKIKRSERKIERFNTNIPRFREIIERNGNCPNLVRRLTAKIKRMEGFLAFQTELKTMTEEVMDMKINERDTLESIEMMGADAKQDLDEEIQAQRDGNVGFNLTGTAPGNETVAVNNEMLMPTFFN